MVGKGTVVPFPHFDTYAIESVALGQTKDEM